MINTKPKWVHLIAASILATIFINYILLSEQLQFFGSSNKAFFRVTIPAAAVVEDANTNINNGGVKVLIEILHGKAPNACEYSVTIESRGIYTGSAIRIDVHENNNNNNDSSQRAQTHKQSFTWLFSWTAPFPGNYQILVHEIDQQHRIGPKSLTPLLKPSPYRFSIGEGSSSSSPSLFASLERSSNIPCQSLNRPDAYSKWDGDWIGPAHPLGRNDGMRTGWNFIPNQQIMGCSLETFSRHDLLSLRTKKSIYILGTSIQRGVFLSLVDMLLSVSEKEQMVQSVIGKCWGRAVIEKGNLEITYQDFRVAQFENLRAPKYWECHNNKVAKRPDDLFIDKALHIWDEVFEDSQSWPSVILMAVNYNTVGTTQHAFFDHIETFVRKLPPSWDGTLVLADNYMNAMRGSLNPQRKYDNYLSDIREMLERLNDHRVRWIDGMGLSRQMVMYAEFGPDAVSRSQHYHRFCDIPYVDEFESNSIRVCSNVTEMLGQLLLGHALGPKADFEKEKVQDPEEGPLSYCHACPRTMFPIHLVPHPEMTCGVGPLHVREKREIFKAKDVKANTCPKWCLDQEVTERMPSQSDIINIRRCEISKT